MKNYRIFLILVGFSFSFINSNSQDKPNVIVIMTDDLGYADVGFNGSIEIPTPNIDRIADNGVKFSSGYTTYSVCGPSRAGFMTGRYQQRFGFERNPLYRVDDPNMGLPLDEVTIAESVSKVGYISGIIGKWHLGAHISNHPLNRGFNEFYGHLGGGHKYFPEALVIEDSYAAKNESESYTTWLLRNHTPEKTNEYITDEFSNEAVRFVTRHKNNPFFLLLSYNAPHTPMEAREDDLALFPNLSDKRKVYAAMVHAVDRGVGKVLDKVQELGIEENTIIFFLSDNGGPESKNASDNGALRGGKSDVYEGGYRVPFAMQWKNTITAELDYEYPVSSLDIFATLAAVSKSPINPDKPLDGTNLIPHLIGDDETAPHNTIHIRKIDQDRHAIRQGNYKLIHFKDGSNKKLYDLSTNISESDTDGNNLYWNTDFRSKRDELENLFQTWESELMYPRFVGLIHDELVWAEKLQLSNTNLQLNVDETVQLTTTILPNDAFNDEITWTSNNSSVATVNKDGLVSAHTDGYALITVKVADRPQVYTECIVKVGHPLVPSSIQVSETEVVLITGERVNLKANVLPEPSQSFSVVWSSSNTDVATVNENGFVITHSEGVAQITASVLGSPSIKASCNIIVNNYSEPLNINFDSKNEPALTIYPNPVTDIIRIHLLNPVLEGEISIYNTKGNLLLREDITNSKTSVALKMPGNVPDGVYIINVKGVHSNDSSRFVFKRQ